MARAEICIIGAGAAGITLAREFIGQPFRVALIESGGFEFDLATQELYGGSNIGHDYIPLDQARLRYFGGTTNHWGGNCLPIRPMNFEPRPWIPFSGWPITWTQLLPFYRRAHDVIGLGEFDYDPSHLSAKLGKALFPFDPSRFETVFSRYRALRFGEEFKEAIGQAENVTTYLYANVLPIERNSETDSVAQVTVATLAGKRYTVQARYFVLAVGGIENARLLLLSNNVQAAGLGNQNDLVGRFFMEHIWYPSGSIIPVDQSTELDVYEHQHSIGDDVEVRAHLALPEDVVRREQIPDFRAEIGASQLSPESFSWSHIVRCLRTKDRALECMKHLGAYVVGMLAEMGGRLGQPSEGGGVKYRLNNYVEQIPNPESRVTLSDEKDALGLRRVHLKWQLSDLDKYGIRRAHELLALEVGRSGFGRLRFELPDHEEEILHGAGGGNHHLGTTRMSDDPKTGVVDADCRLYGLHNLYVAGSSVFPTGGSANPTLTIVALSLKLADHLKAKFRT
ncbi:MAG: GMC family oxidoreductase [Deltaproteobacteria bacterium]|nr:GMC family oxidoreductase [Deltaproteobacteria bacterium]